MPEIVRVVNTGPLALESDLTTDLANTNTLIARLTAQRAANLDFLTGSPASFTTSQIAQVHPALGAPVSIPCTAFPTFGAWTQIVAGGVVPACALIGLYVRPAINAGASQEWQMEIGVGAAASEVSIGRYCFSLNWASTVGAIMGIYVPVHPSPIIAANARISARLTGTTTFAVSTSVHVLPTPF